MLTLLLLRHAKAEDHGRGDDFARTLTDKGTGDADRLGAYLDEAGLVPSLALVSSAARTSETFTRISAHWRKRPETRRADELYNASAGELLGRIRQTGAGAKALLVVGHNPGIAEAATILARDGDPIERERMRRRFPPCAIAIVTFEADEWRDACVSGGRLDAYLTPEDLSDRD